MRGCTLRIVKIKGPQLEAGEGLMPQASGSRKAALGDYASQLSRALYEAAPKAVFAAIAVSPAMNGGTQVEDDETADRYVLREWSLLHRQGLVAQAPPKKLLALVGLDQEAK